MILRFVFFIAFIGAFFAPLLKAILMFFTTNSILNFR